MHWNKVGEQGEKRLLEFAVKITITISIGLIEKETKAISTIGGIDTIVLPYESFSGI